MEQLNLVIPFKFLKVGISDFAIETLSMYRLSVSRIVSVCTDFISEFSYTSPEGLVMPDPLVLSAFIQSEFHISFAEYVLEQSLNIPFNRRVPKKMIYQMVADIAYVITVELLPPLQQYVSHSNYPIEKITIGVIGADLTAVQLELKYEPYRQPTYKFCHYEPTDVQPMQYLVN